MPTKFKKGQALSELAVGMLAFALVASAVIGFALYIGKALEMQRTLRAEAGRGALHSIGGPGSYSSASDSKRMRVEPLAGEYIFGSTEVDIKENVYIPKMGVLK